MVHYDGTALTFNRFSRWGYFEVLQMNVHGKLSLDRRAQRVSKDTAAIEVHFRQLASLRAGRALSVLDNRKIIQVAGRDAELFLQGQLSSDVRELSDERSAQYSSYCTAKGRMLASFFVWRFCDVYYLMVAEDLVTCVISRLSMFVLRSKVEISIADNLTLVGISGVPALNTLAIEPALAAKAVERKVVQSDLGLLIGLPGKGWLLAADETGAERIDKMLMAGENVISSRIWDWRDVDAGIPWVQLATREQFVPQMVNLELIGGVSFNKGCYPGQEVVARSQYLGKLKRRLFKAVFEHPLCVGGKLYSPSVPGQSIGMIMAVCQVDIRKYEALVVVQSQCWKVGIYADEKYLIKLEERGGYSR